MLRLQRSPTNTENPDLKKVLRTPGQNNAEYVAAHASPDPSSAFDLVLLGGMGPVDFRLRAAQADARDDLLPSAWSHAAFLLPGAAPRELLHIPLSSHVGLDYPPASNGVQRGPLADYADPAAYPNVALLRVPVPFGKLEPVLARFQKQRTVLDALELTLAWWAYVWGVGRSTNPLLADLGVPGAAFVEYCSSAAGFDLVPGFPSRSSCPEAIWVAARWWHEHPRMVPVGEAAAAATLPFISGVYDAEHYLVPVP